MRAEQFRHVRFQRDQIRRVPGVAPDRNGAGDVFVQQAKRPAEEIDAGRDNRRTHAVLVEHEQLDEIVRMALMVRCVDHAAGFGGSVRGVYVLSHAFDLAEDWVEGVLQRAVNRVALRGAQFFEIALDAHACVRSALTMTAIDVPSDVRPGEHGFGDLIRDRHSADYSTRSL